MITPVQISTLSTKLDYLREELEEFKDDKSSQLDDFLESDNPNEHKVSILELQLGILEDALVNLEETISVLNDYV